VYSRRLREKTLTFGHEGVLYRASFMLYDKGTRSLWVHTTGACVKGPLKGERLRFLAASVVPWKTWKAQHPATRVLQGKADRQFMGTLSLRYRPHDFGLSVGQGDAPKLVLFSDLAKHGVINDTLARKGDHPLPIVVVYDRTTRTARAFERGSRTFRLEGGVLVASDGTRWDSLRLTREDSNERLVQIPATQWLIERWRGFYPNGIVDAR